MKIETINCDVIVNGRFYLQFIYPHPPIFKLNISDVYKYAKEKFESLRDKDFKIEFSTNRICKQR